MTRTPLQARLTYASLRPAMPGFMPSKTMKVNMPSKFVVSIVDDDPSVCEGLQDLLSSMGFTAETFPGADEFLKSGHIERTSCLIADVQMPGMTGFELHDHLSASGRTMTTILITAFPKDLDRARAMRTGVDCYLSKPFSEKDLLACIHSAFASRGADDPG